MDSFPSRRKGFFSTLQCPDMLWGLPNLMMGWSSSPGRIKNSNFSISSRLCFTKPPIEWVTGAHFPGISGRGVKLTTHLQLVPRLRNYGSLHPLPHTSSWLSSQLSTGTNFVFTSTRASRVRRPALVHDYLFSICEVSNAVVPLLRHTFLRCRLNDETQGQRYFHLTWMNQVFLAFH
jgi:hypothetical protein